MRGDGFVLLSAQNDDVEGDVKCSQPAMPPRFCTSLCHSSRYISNVPDLDVLRVEFEDGTNRSRQQANNNAACYSHCKNRHPKSTYAVRSCCTPNLEGEIWR